MSNANTSSSTPLVSYAQDIDYTNTEGFKQFCSIYNQKNPRAACNNQQGAYLTAEDIYNTIKSSGCSQRTFEALSLQDFIMSGSIVAHHQLKHLSLAPYYVAQMKCCMQKWDRHDNQGAGLEVVDTCCQLIGVVDTGLYHSMVDIQTTARSNCRSSLASTNSSYRWTIRFAMLTMW